MLQNVWVLCKLPGTVSTLKHRLAITTKTDQSVKHCVLPRGPGAPKRLLMLIRTPAMTRLSLAVSERHHKHMEVSITLLIFKSQAYLFCNALLKGNKKQTKSPCMHFTWILLTTPVCHPYFLIISSISFPGCLKANCTYQDILLKTRSFFLT